MRRYSRLLITAALLLTLFVTYSSQTRVSAQTPNPSNPQAADLLKQIPADYAGLYKNLESIVQASAYDTFKMPATPWKWCHSESFMGNPWRVAFTNELKRLVEVYQKNGLVSSWELSDSNGDVAQQNSQIRAFIDKKCSLITTIAGSTTGLNEAIKASYDAGIPFITVASPVTSPYAINVGYNSYLWGLNMANYIAKQLNGKGNVLMVSGIPGQPIVALEDMGGNDGWKANPGLNIVAKVNGNWAPDVTKQVTLQTLATNPAQIDAVWTTGSESRFIAQSFEEAGRPVVLITGSISGDALGYWKANPDKYKFYGSAILPGWHAQVLFRVAVRTLMGQQPKLNTIFVKNPEVTTENLDKWYRPCMTIESTTTFPIPPEDVISEADLNNFFKKGEPIKFYDYKDTPDPCAASK